MRQSFGSTRECERQFCNRDTAMLVPCWLDMSIGYVVQCFWCWQRIGKCFQTNSADRRFASSKANPHESPTSRLLLTLSCFVSVSFYLLRSAARLRPSRVLHLPRDHLLRNVQRVCGCLRNALALILDPSHVQRPCEPSFLPRSNMVVRLHCPCADRD